MTTDAARALAQSVMDDAAMMNASYEHIPSKNKAFLAGAVMDLCSQLDAAHAEIAALRLSTAVEVPIFAPEPITADPDVAPDPVLGAESAE